MSKLDIAEALGINLKTFSDVCDYVQLDEFYVKAGDMKIIEATQKLAHEILAAKAAAGSSSYLWLHETAGDCILWPSEAASVDDSGVNALQRWSVDAHTAKYLATIEGINLAL